jgi:hypothetical protein
VFLFHESISRQQTQSIERRRRCRYAEPQQRAAVIACNPKGADRRRAVLIVWGVLNADLRWKTRGSLSKEGHHNVPTVRTKVQ